VQSQTGHSCYEYIAVYVDDLALGMKDPQTFLTTLEAKHKFKLKGSGPINFHLGSANMKGCLMRNRR